jgi:5-methylcytosine-specific restriction enzyme B
MGTDAFDELLAALCRGRDYAPEPREELTNLLDRTFEERYHSRYRKHFQTRNALGRKADSAAWAGWIGADNPTSGAYQGTSLVWFPGQGGSVLTLCVGTAGFGPDAHLLARPGHRRRLQALARLHGGRLWVKPDFLDLQTSVPGPVRDAWPAIEAALGRRPGRCPTCRSRTAPRPAGPGPAAPDGARRPSPHPRWW